MPGAAASERIPPDMATSSGPPHGRLGGPLKTLLLTVLGDDLIHGPASLGLVDAVLRQRGLDVDTVNVAAADIAPCRGDGAA